jgi:hypothetical protein
MSVLALELNDAGLVSATAEGWRDEGPGYALLDPEAPLFGAAARASARLRPRRLNDRYWAELSGAPLPRQESYARSHADLVCAHLAAIWRGRTAGADEAVFVVPGYLGRESLGLLLGIAAELEIGVTGLVDAAVAATTALAPGRELVHLDFHLHGALLTRLEQSGAVRRGEVAALPRAGLRPLEDAWAHAVAGAFVRQTRYDPLHAAESEQALYDRLGDWLPALEDDEEIEISLELKGEPLQVRLARGAVLDAAAGAYRALAERLEGWRRPGMELAVQLSHRGAALPGLARYLENLPGVELLRLAPDAAVSGALARLPHIVSGEGTVRFVTALPALDTRAAPAAAAGAAPAAANGVAPTHLLYEGEARPITAQGLGVGIAPPADRPGVVLAGPASGISRLHCTVREEHGRIVVEDHSRYGTFVNDVRIRERAELRPGDRIRVGSPGVLLHAIRVRSEP